MSDQEYENWINREFEKQKAENQGKESGNSNKHVFYILKPGKTVIRVIPPEDKIWFREVTEYFVRPFGYITSPKDFDMEDPISDWVRSVYQSGNEDEIEKVSSFRSNTRYIMNAIIISSPDEVSPSDGIKVLKVPTEVKRHLVKYECDKTDWGNIIDYEDGLNIIIEREGSGQYDTKYTIIPQSKRSNIFQLLAERDVDPSTLVIHDLDEVHRSGVKTHEEMLGIVEQLKGEVDSKSKPKASKMSFGGSKSLNASSSVGTTTGETASSSSFTSPAMVAPEGQSLPEGVVIPEPPKFGKKSKKGE